MISGTASCTSFGFGAYSTTWLARDQTAGKYVAIQESDILGLLGQGDAHPGKDIIPPVLDEFVLDGPNGTHRCLVTVPARMSVAEAKDVSSSRLFQLPVARAIVAQLVQAVAFLHARGVVYGGR